MVIPVRDDAQLLDRCLRALADQHLMPDEVIVVDNASVDDSATIASGWGARVIRCAEVGIAAASAQGYDAAHGDLILRLDADCVAPPSWTADIARLLRDRPDLDAVTGGARFVDGPALLRRTAWLYLTAYALATIPALGHRPLFGSNMGFRKTAWQRVSGDVHRHDAHIHDDLDLAFHLGAPGRIGTLRAEPMGISMRPLWSVRAFARRVRRGFHTVFLHWPHDLPPRRWRAQRSGTSTI